MYQDQKIIKTMKNKIISNTRNSFEREEEEEGYYRSENYKWYGDNFVIYETRGYKNKTLLMEECFNKIRSYLTIS